LTVTGGAVPNGLSTVIFAAAGAVAFFRLRLSLIQSLKAAKQADTQHCYHSHSEMSFHSFVLLRINNQFKIREIVEPQNNRK